MSFQLSSTAWALLVVSDIGQADTLLDQKSWAQETARANGWDLTEIFEGVSSGKLGVRKHTRNAIEALRALPAADRPARLLTIRLDRLGRGVGAEAIEAFTTLRSLGVVVHTRLDGDVSYNRASDLLMPMVRLMIGGMENEVRRDKAVAKYQDRRVRQRDDPTIAISTKMPYGLRLENGHYAPKPPEDAAVRLAYELKVQGYGCLLIAKRLAVVAPPMTLKDGSEHPQRWTPDRVSRLIKKTSYRGIIVDDETWTRAQRPAREVTRPTMRFEYPLGGALRCECGYALVGVHGPHKSSDFVYYQCRNKELHGRLKHYRGDRLDAQFSEILERLRADDGLIERFLEAGSASDDKAMGSLLTVTRTELSRIDDRRRAIYVAFEDGLLARTDLQWRLDDLERQHDELRERGSQLEAELRARNARKRTADDVRALVVRARELWLEAKIDDRRALAKAVGNAFGGLVVGLDGTLRIGPPTSIPVRSPKLKARQ
jgi:hypothetical protein